MSFELLGVAAELMHLNLRKEGDDEDKVLAVDAKFACTVDWHTMIHFDPKLRLMMFTRDGEVQFPMMGAISWNGEVRNMDVDVSDVDLIGVTLKKFTFLPLNVKGKPVVKMEFSVPFKPSGREAALLADLLREEVILYARSQPGLPLGEREPVAEGFFGQIKENFVARGGVEKADGSIDLSTIPGMEGVSVMSGSSDGKLHRIASQILDLPQPERDIAIAVVKGKAKANRAKKGKK